MPKNTRRGATGDEPSNDASWKSLAKAAGAIVAFLSTVLALFAGLVALGAVSNPFESNIDRLTKAGQQLSDAGSAKVDMSRIIDTASNRVTQTGQGNLDFRSGSGELQFTNGIKEIFLPPYFYETGPAITGHWCKFDLSALPPGLLWGAYSDFQNDPGAVIRNLDTRGTSKNVGDEVLFGVPVTHYAGAIDLTKIISITRDSGLQSLLKRLAQINNDRLPVDVWVEKSDDRVAQLEEHFGVLAKDVGLPGTDKVHFDVVFGFSHFGVDASVRQPSADATLAPGKNGCPTTP